MADQEEQLLKALIAAAPGILNGNMAFLASTVWFLWDWAISIDQEVEHFWGKKLTTGTVLYFLNRFLGLFLTFIHFQTSVRVLSVDGTNRLCKPLASLIIILNGLSGFVVQTVLVLRTYALWNCNKYVLWFLMSVSIAATLAQEGLAAEATSIMRILYNPLPPPYSGCLLLLKNQTWQRYVPIVIFEIIVASFMFIEFLRFIHQGKSNRVLYVIFRDGFLEFIAVTVTSIFSLFVGIFQPGGADNFDLVAFDLSSSISLICCARMLLNIRDVLTLSDPRDSTKPNPWSLDPSFDVRYGLGGMNEITLDQLTSGRGEELVSGYPISGGGTVSGTTNNDSARWARGEMSRTRDEESGPGVGVGEYDRNMMLDSDRFGDDVASVHSPASLMETHPESSSPENMFLPPLPSSLARRGGDLEEGEGPGPSGCGSNEPRGTSRKSGLTGEEEPTFPHRPSIDVGTREAYGGS